MEIEEILTKIAELKGIKQMLIDEGQYNPNAMDTDNLIEQGIKYFEQMLNFLYGKDTNTEGGE